MKTWVISISAGIGAMGISIAIVTFVCAYLKVNDTMAAFLSGLVGGIAITCMIAYNFSSEKETHKDT